MAAEAAALHPARLQEVQLPSGHGRLLPDLLQHHRHRELAQQLHREEKGVVSAERLGGLHRRRGPAAKPHGDHRRRAHVAERAQREGRAREHLAKRLPAERVRLRPEDPLAQGHRRHRGPPGAEPARPQRRHRQAALPELRRCGLARRAGSGAEDDGLQAQGLLGPTPRRAGRGPGCSDRRLPVGGEGGRQGRHPCLSLPAHLRRFKSTADTPESVLRAPAATD
mmetsp:Transcript_110698/g.318206  ORF Transcript_110698/g.318206 Transcript_110698/m.318206 type:complete len:224 (-) Transcript_110698:83-754(-)